MVLSEPDYYLAFHYCNGIGPKRFTQILQVFGTAEKAWNSPIGTWQKLGFPRNITVEVAQHKQEFDISKEKELLAKLGISYLPSNNPQFPQLLKQIPDCPIGLFLKGAMLPQDVNTLAVVGTRKVTPYGREVTQRLVAGLVLHNLTIISGLARGVDGIAHRTALENGGRTIAVLGSGLDQIYPPEHRQLSQDILKNGALLSEYPPQTKPSPGNFPARNRIISGMSLGVLVTEGASKSGSKITAMLALDQNRDVFAVPGSITSPMSTGPAELIQLGAKLVMSEKDIIDELNLTLFNDVPEKCAPFSQSQPSFSDKKHKKIWQYLQKGTQHIDVITRETRLPIATVTTCLTLMEIKGLVKNLGDGNYMVV
ncbi:MAG: DNA-processing protein DprA [Patescibacteria group bacterium]